MRDHEKRVEEYARIIASVMDPDYQSHDTWRLLKYKHVAEMVIKQADCEILAGAHDSGFLKSIMEKYSEQ